jgi:hypothetical protein
MKASPAIRGPKRFSSGIAATIPAMTMSIVAMVRSFVSGKYRMANASHDAADAQQAKFNTRSRRATFARIALRSEGQCLHQGHGTAPWKDLGA